jgi:hypothetical protein
MFHWQELEGLMFWKSVITLNSPQHHPRCWVLRFRFHRHNLRLPRRPRSLKSRLLSQTEATHIFNTLGNCNVPTWAVRTDGFVQRPIRAVAALSLSTATHDLAECVIASSKVSRNNGGCRRSDQHHNKRKVPGDRTLRSDDGHGPWGRPGHSHGPQNATL